MVRLGDGRVVIVTGAGRGIGRCHALAFAKAGAKVIVNDLGGAVDGSGRSVNPAQAVVDEIKAAGGDAIADTSNVADWQGARHLVNSAIDAFGRLDVLVNNAGILRDRMLVNMVEEEWDAVIKVHLKGTFAPSHWASEYWRDRAKQGETNDARIINTSSASGLYGNPGQTNYGAAKAGIAAFTIIAARELERYGVTVNAVAPGARTRMTTPLGYGTTETHQDDFDAFAPENIPPLVVWLGSNQSREVTGRVFNVAGGKISVAEGWSHGPSIDKGARWDSSELDEVIPELISKARPPATLFD